MSLRVCAVALIAVLSPAGPALSQSSPGMAPSYTGGSTADYERQQREYWRAQEAERMEQQRRAQEESQRQSRSAEESRSSTTTNGAPSNPRPASSSYDPRAAAELQALRAKLLRMPPLPDERNTLLGRWRVETAGKPRRKDELGQLMGMLSNPGAAACQFTFGDGIVEFKPKSWSSIDGYGDDSLGPIAYRADGKRLFALPAKGIEIMGFDVVNPNRVEVFNLAGCALIRVTGAATATPGGQSNRAPSASAGVGAPGPARSSTAPQLAAAAPAAPPSTLARPSPEVCRQTLIDKLGTVGVNQVRAMSDARFREPAIEGKEPNTGNLRIDLRGSACDDPRIKATLYDFDAAGMLQSITYVWDRPAGPAPAPVFQERVAALSRVHALPPPQTPGRLQADTSLGRLIVQDMPERGLLLEAYRAKR